MYKRQAVRGAAQRAIERARAGEGPTLLECLTYRYRGHSLADPDELRSEKETDFWGKRDPIKKLAKEIIDSKLATEEELKSIEKKIDPEISQRGRIDLSKFAFLQYGHLCPLHLLAQVMKNQNH